MLLAFKRAGSEVTERFPISPMLVSMSQQAVDGKLTPLAMLRGLRKSGIGR